MNNNLRKLNKILFITFLVLFGIGFVVLGPVKILKVDAAPLADTADVFYVDRPLPSSSIFGTSTVRFKIVDDENTKPEYEVALFQPDCKVKFGTIVQNDYTIRNSSNVYTKSWNTNGPILDKASIPNGNYCLRVCVTLKNGTNNYAVCDLRAVKIVDEVNHAPVITTTLSNTNYLIGQNFGYDVNATDADGDHLTYSLTSAPKFLQINSSTGVITSKGALDTVGSFSVVVKVTDSKGASDTQKFTIKIVSAPTPNIGSVTIISPTKDSIFKDGQQNTIQWQISNISSISAVVLYYSADAKDWTKIDSVDQSVTSYLWDVKSIKSGDYYILVRITSGASTNYEDISDKFSVVSGGENIQSSPSIIEVSPEADSKNDSVDEIRATIVPSTGKLFKDSSLKVTLDDTDITSKCNLSENKIICKLDSKLTAGRHKAYVEFTDSSDKKAQKDWFFDVNEQTSGGSETDTGVNWKSLPILLVICLAVLLLLLIPWAIYTLWRRRNDDKEEPVAPYDETTYNITNDMAPIGQGVSPVVGYSAPVVTTTSYEDEEPEDEYAIGEASLGEDEYKAPVQPVVAAVPVVETPVVTTEPVTQTIPVAVDLQASGTTDSGVISTYSAPVAPATPVSSTPAVDNQLDEEDIPEWLKAEDLGDDASSPINAQGQKIDLETVDEKKAENQGSQPYSDYGLASQDNAQPSGSTTSTTTTTTTT